MKKLSEIIGDPEASGVYLYEDPLRPQELERPIKGQGPAFFHIRGKDIRDKDQFLRSCAETLQFPDYFGANWDALEDCLTDMSWNVSEGYVIVYDHFHFLAENSPGDFHTAVQIFRESARFWRKEGKAFLVVLHGKGIEGQDLPSVKH